MGTTPRFRDHLRRFAIHYNPIRWRVNVAHRKRFTALIQADSERRALTWPNPPETYDCDFLDATEEEVEFVRQWMRDGYEDAVERFKASGVSKDDPGAVVSWGYDDPYFGPLIRGYSGFTKAEVTADATIGVVPCVFPSLVAGGKFAPSEEEWKPIHDEIHALQEAA